MARFGTRYEGRKMEDEGRKIKVEVDILQYLKYFRPAHKCIITRLSLSLHITSPSGTSAYHYLLCHLFLAPSSQPDDVRRLIVPRPLSVLAALLDVTSISYCTPPPAKSPPPVHILFLISTSALISRPHLTARLRICTSPHPSCHTHHTHPFFTYSSLHMSGFSVFLTSFVFQPYDVHVFALATISSVFVWLPIAYCSIITPCRSQTSCPRLVATHSHSHLRIPRPPHTLLLVYLISSSRAMTVSLSHPIESPLLLYFYLL